MTDEVKTGPRRSGALSAGLPSKIKTKGVPMYFTFKDGNGFEIKVANTDNPLVCDRNQIVEIETVKKSNTVEPRFSVSNAYDDEMGMYFGVPIGIDKRTGDLKWQRFTIGDRKTYDCKRHADAVEWSVVKRSSFLEGSPYQRGKVFYKQFDKEAEAREIIVKSTLRVQANEIATKMIAIEDQMDMYRNFGKNPEGFTMIMLQAEIIKIAERNPKEFIDIWNNKNRSALTTFNRCISVGLITFNIGNGGYMWKESFVLGSTEQTALQALIDNKNILNQAEIESRQKDTMGKKMMSAAEAKFFQPEEGEENVELVELRMAAKLLQLADYMSMDIDTLRKYVDEAGEN